MIGLLEFIIFILFNLYALKKAVGYGFYEYKNNNKFGGFFIIIFSILVVILSIISLCLA